MQEISKPSRPIVTHGFSVGGYLYGEMLLKLEQQPDKYADIRSRLVGQVRYCERFKMFVAGLNICNKKCLGLI